LLDAAEMKHGLPMRVGQRDPVANLLGRGHLEERLQLVLHVPFGLAPEEQPPHHRPQTMDKRHAPSSTLAIANETRFQRSRCFSSCRRPEAVRL
jgi:hypothetical protein